MSVSFVPSSPIGKLITTLTDQSLSSYHQMVVQAVMSNVASAPDDFMVDHTPSMKRQIAVNVQA